MPKLAKRSELRFFEDGNLVNTIPARQRSFADLEEIANRFLRGGPAGHLKEVQFWSKKLGLRKVFELKHVIRSDRRVPV